MCIRDSPYSTVHIGQITGGRALNIVPDRAQLDMEFRHLAETPAQDIQRKIEAIAKRISRAYPAVPAIVVEAVNAYPGLDTSPSDTAVSWAEQMSGGQKKTKVSFGTEAGFFAELGLSTVVIGPGDMASDGHKPDEGLSKSELDACDTMMSNVLSALS